MNNRKYIISLVALALVATLSIGSFVIAQSMGGDTVTINNTGDVYVGASQGSTGEASLGGSTSSDWNVGGALSVTGATTLTGAVGINGTSTATTILDMLGTVRTYPAGVASTTCDTGSSGAMMYSTGTAKLMGCDGTTWQALW